MHVRDKNIWKNFKNISCIVSDIKGHLGKNKNKNKQISELEDYVIVSHALKYFINSTIIGWVVSITFYIEDLLKYFILLESLKK